MTAWVAFLLALTCADGSCDIDDWGALPPAREALDLNECPATDPACADLQCSTDAECAVAYNEEP